ncbi:MAG: helix-turn-helix domain-containing protein [Vicinamibacteria bacterium]
MIDLKVQVDGYERELILGALREAGGRQRQAARILGILPTTLHEKMKRLGIPTARELYVGDPARDAASAIATPLAS